MNEKQVDPKELRASMPAWFKTSPIGQTILADTAAREVADRKATVDRLVAVRASHAALIPPLKRAAEAALKRVEEAKEALKVAEQEYRQAEGRRGTQDIDLTMRAQRLERDLYEAAPAEIDVFIKEMNLLFDKNRFEIRSSEHAGRMNVLTMRRQVVHSSNSAAVHARLQAITDAIATAEALKLAFVVPLDLEARLEVLRKGVLAISIDKSEEHTREPYRNSPPPQQRYA